MAVTYTFCYYHTALLKMVVMEMEYLYIGYAEGTLKSLKRD